MVKNGLSIVVAAVLLGHLNASWFWGSAPETKIEAVAEVQVTTVEQPQVSAENPTPTVESEATKTQVSAFLQSVVMIPQETEAAEMVGSNGGGHPEVKEPNTDTVPMITETEAKEISQEPIVTETEVSTPSPVVTKIENASSSPEVTETENASSSPVVTETEDSQASPVVSETEPSNPSSVATETEQSNSSPVVQPASNWSFVNWLYGAQQATPTVETKESVIAEQPASNVSVSEPTAAATQEELEKEILTVQEPKPEPTNVNEELVTDTNEQAKEEAMTVEQPKEEPKSVEELKEEPKEEPKKPMRSVKAANKTKRKAMVAKKAKKEPKKMEKPEEKPTAIEEPKTVVEAPVYSGWSLFRFWSSPTPVTTETPKVEQSLEAAVAEVADGQQVDEHITTETAPKKIKQPRKKTLEKKTSRRQIVSQEASRPYRFKGERQELPRPIVNAKTRTIQCPVTADLSFVKQIFDELTKDNANSRYFFDNVPADLIQSNRMVELALAYDFEIVDKEASSVYIQRKRRGIKSVSKLLVDELMRKDTRRKQAEQEANATPDVTSVDKVSNLFGEDFDSLPTIPQDIPTDANPRKGGRQVHLSKNIPHSQKPIFRRQHSAGAICKSAVTSTGDNQSAALSAKLTNGKEAMNAAEIKGAVMEAKEILQAMTDNVESSGSSGYDFSDEDYLEFPEHRVIRSIKKSSFPPLTDKPMAEPRPVTPGQQTYLDVAKLNIPEPIRRSHSSAMEDNEPAYDMQKFFARDRFAAPPELDAFDMNKLFYSSSSASTSNDEVFFDLNDFFGHHAFTAMQDSDDFNMFDFFYSSTPRPLLTPRQRTEQSAARGPAGRGIGIVKENVNNPK